MVSAFCSSLVQTSHVFWCDWLHMRADAGVSLHTQLPWPFLGNNLKLPYVLSRIQIIQDCDSAVSGPLHTPSGKASCSLLSKTYGDNMVGSGTISSNQPGLGPLRAVPDSSLPGATQITTDTAPDGPSAEHLWSHWPTWRCKSSAVLKSAKFCSCLHVK